MSDISKKTTFTPGPWFHDGDLVFVDSRYQQCCGRADLNGQCCGNPEVAGDYGEIAQTSECNASLIAAVPELYAVLVDFMENPNFRVAVGGNPNAVDTLMDRARHALSKARGEDRSHEGK